MDEWAEQENAWEENCTMLQYKNVTVDESSTHTECSWATPGRDFGDHLTDTLNELHVRKMRRDAMFEEQCSRCMKNITMQSNHIGFEHQYNYF